MMRTVYGDQERFEKTYFSRFPGYYMSGDGAKRDKDGYIWITGRIDDMLNVSGHLMSTAQVESVLVEHSKVAESAVVPIPHPVKVRGQTVVLVSQILRSFPSGRGSLLLCYHE